MIRKYALYSIAALILLATSCKKDEETVPAPVITIDATKTSTIVEVGDSALVVGTVTTTGKLATVKITNKAGGDVISDLSTDAKGTTSFSFEVQVPIAATAGAGSVTLVVTATDQSATPLSSTKEVTFVVTEPVVTKNTVLIGDDANPSVGSFYSVVENKTYLSGQAPAASSKLEFIYYASSGVAYLGGPTNAGVQARFTSVTTWATKNVVYFKKLTGVSTVNFAAIYTAAEGAATDKATSVSDLKAGDYVGFMCEATNVAGIAKVVSIVGGSAATAGINLEVSYVISE